MAGTWQRRTVRLVGTAVFVAAASMRLALVETARFTSDEALDYAVGMDIAHGVGFPLLGPIVTSGRARHPGPLTYWLAGFPQLFTRAPEAGNVFFELMGAAMVWMFWYGLRRPFGDGAATFSALLLAFSPWSVLYGDHVWNPHAFLVFEGLALLAVLELRERPNSAWAAALPVACLALPHLHSSAPVVWLALVPLMWGHARRWNRRYLALGFALAALLYIPYAVNEAQTSFGNTRAFFAETFNAPKKVQSVNVMLSPIYVLRMLTLDVTYHELSGYWGGLNEAAAWHALWHGSSARPFHPLRLVALIASGALLGLAAVTTLWAALARYRAPRAAASVVAGTRESLRPFAVAAVVAVVADTALLALTGKQVFGHYVAPAMPFVFVLFAAGARASFSDPRLRAAMVALAVIVCAGGAEATLMISRRIDARNGLAVHRAVAARVLQDCAAAERQPAMCSARLDFGFVGSTYTHAIFSRVALAAPIRWEATPRGFVYRLQKREDPSPVGADAFPTITIGPVSLYRLR
jgi:hypothetical protein